MGKGLAWWIAGEGRKKNRAQLAGFGDVGGQGSTDRGGTEVRSQNENRKGAGLGAGWPNSGLGWAGQGRAGLEQERA